MRQSCIGLSALGVTARKYNSTGAASAFELLSSRSHIYGWSVKFARLKKGRDIEPRDDRTPHVYIPNSRVSSKTCSCELTSSLLFSIKIVGICENGARAL